MIHVVYTRPMQVVNGSVVNKNDATINQMTSANLEMRVIEDSDIASSSGNPNIKDYLEAEDADGYNLAHMDNNIIVTQK